MTVPAMNDLLVAARKKLLADPGFAALLGVDVGRDPAGGTWADAWVFRGQFGGNDPVRVPAGSGKAAVTMNMRDSWGAPDDYHSTNFRVLRFSIWADCSRSASDSTLISARDAELRCDRVATAIKTVFNDVANEDHWWPGGVYVTSCTLRTDLQIMDVPQQDSLVEGMLSFKLVIG